MMSPRDTQFLVNEALSLLNRLEGVQPFALNTPMVQAAGISAEAMDAISSHLTRIRQQISERIRTFIENLKAGATSARTSAEAQADFVLLKLRFNNLLDQLDIFADVLLQRGEHGTGTWVAGLDVLASDTLNLPGNYYSPPPLICFLQRGHGAAIRRARTRLPGGDENPVGIIQVPRERMVGSGIASSLVHEVGHQGSELLGLTASLKLELQQRLRQADDPLPWQLFERWLNEILSDFWAMAHLGITATVGLMSVVSLPSYFVFRISNDGPHPFPWIRVKTSIAFGRKLYPHPQWDALERQWENFYPTSELPQDKQQLIAQLEAALPEFVERVVYHAVPALHGRRLIELFPYQQRQPEQLQQLFGQWRASRERMKSAPPSLAFAVIGQAKADGQLTARDESRLLMDLLTHWALERAKNYCVIPKTLEHLKQNGYQRVTAS
ncbi:hypothetical protein [Tellurirhabdus rosea]|uniref:hypothetical protein n=1 Tax=Tellurirhabdus rosea TaxID=2674997 RepID=UPI0022530477|nr:hypothetical protein [Tellurirhabdus rosea]